MSDAIGIFIVIMPTALCVVGLGAWELATKRGERRLRDYKQARIDAERENWIVTTETQNGWANADDGSDKHSRVVVSCTRRDSDDVVIGHHDARRDDVKEAVAKLQTQAGERCGDLNALEVRKRARTTTSMWEY